MRGLNGKIYLLIHLQANPEINLQTFLQIRYIKQIRTKTFSLVTVTTNIRIPFLIHQYIIMIMM